MSSMGRSVATWVRAGVYNRRVTSVRTSPATAPSLRSRTLSHRLVPGRQPSIAASRCAAARGAGRGIHQAAAGGSQPASSNAYDFLAEALEAAGERREAVAVTERALEVLAKQELTPEQRGTWRDSSRRG
jgi:hypothetical protein